MAAADAWRPRPEHHLALSLAGTNQDLPALDGNPHPVVLLSQRAQHRHFLRGRCWSGRRLYGLHWDGRPCLPFPE